VDWICEVLLTVSKFVASEASIPRFQFSICSRAERCLIFPAVVIVIVAVASISLVYVKRRKGKL
jgi:hypothetical protein